MLLPGQSRENKRSEDNNLNKEKFLMNWLDKLDDSFTVKKSLINFQRKITNSQKDS